MADDNYDAIVIGGGPAGYVAAIRLGQLGQKTLLVEKQHLGGVCLNWGCIPSKALITACGLVDKIQRAEVMGISARDVQVDFGKMQAWKEGIVEQLRQGVRGLVKGNGCDLTMGAARLRDAQSVLVTGPDGQVTTHVARKGIVVATGASPAPVPGFEVDGELVVTAREALSFSKPPGSLLVIGGGAIGMEIGTAYQKLGTRVVVVEMLEQLLPGLDRDLAAVVRRKFVKAGGEVLVSAQAKGWRQGEGDTALVEIEHGGSPREIACDKVLVAAGFRPNSHGLGLQELGLDTDATGHIPTDNQLRTPVPTVYAAGDVCGPPYLAHKASKEGEIAAEVIAGQKSARDWQAMPAAFFTDPEVACVGLSETEARQQDLQVAIGKFPFAASGRAKAMGETDGFIKTVVDVQEGQVLGVSIVGPGAGDLVAEAALGIEMCAMGEDVARTVHPHPTLSESMMESFKHALGEAVHILNRRS